MLPFSHIMKNKTFPKKLILIKLNKIHQTIILQNIKLAKIKLIIQRYLILYFILILNGKEHLVIKQYKTLKKYRKNN